MEFYYQIYFSESLVNKKAKIIRKLKQNKIQPGIYLITLAQGRQNELEFFSILLLQQKIFHPEDLFVVGVASGYEEALELIEEITDDVYQKTKDAKIREYITREQDAYKAGKR